MKFLALYCIWLLLSGTYIGHIPSTLRCSLTVPSRKRGTVKKGQLQRLRGSAFFCFLDSFDPMVTSILGMLYDEEPPKAVSFWGAPR